MYKYYTPHCLKLREMEKGMIKLRIEVFDIRKFVKSKRQVCLRMILPPRGTSINVALISNSSASDTLLFPSSATVGIQY